MNEKRSLQYSSAPLLLALTAVFAEVLRGSVFVRMIAPQAYFGADLWNLMIFFLVIIPGIWFFAALPLRRLRALLSETERKFVDITENAREWLWKTDAEGRYIYASPSVKIILGYEPGEVQSRYFYDFFHHDDRENLKVEILKNFQGRVKINNNITRHLHKDGHTVWLSTSALAIFDRNGRFAGYRGADTDITEQKEAYDSLQVSESRFKSLAEASPDCIKIFNLNGELTYMSPGGLKEHGFKKADDALGWDLLSSIKRTEHINQIKESLENAKKGKISTLEVEHTAEGSNRDWCLLTLAPIKDAEGKIISVFGVSRDISIQKKNERDLKEANERLSELNRSKSEFVSIASHEMKSPLTSILSFAHALRKLQLPPERRERYISKIESECRRLAKMLDNYLDITKIELGGFELYLAETSLGDLIRDTVNTMEAGKRNVVEYQIEEGIPEVLCDPDRIRQVLINIIGNAARHSEEMSRITISLRLIGENVIIGISDEGIGIDSSELKHIFKPFYKGQKETTGLGLAIAGGIITMHGGKIWAESEPGKGSRFFFELPVKGRAPRKKSLVTGKAR